METTTIITIAKALIFPLKALSLLLFAVFSRLFYDNTKIKTKQDITKALILTRIVISSFVFMMVYFAAEYFLPLSANLILLISALAAFSFREVIDTFLNVVKNPSKIKDLLTKSDTVDPSGDDYPEGEGKK